MADIGTGDLGKCREDHPLEACDKAPSAGLAQLLYRISKGVKPVELALCSWDGNGGKKEVSLCVSACYVTGHEAPL